MKLVIAEKPSVANEIAKVIGAKKKEQGYFTGNNYIVSWCVGHLIQLAEPEDYNPDLKKWSLESLPIIPQKYKTVVASKTAKQYKILDNLIKRSDIDELICATDAGREGELIFRLVYYKTGTKKPFKRLWISSMEEKAIKDGFQNLKDGKEYDNLFMSALCRQRADWLVGMNITRLYTVMYNKLLRVGRVQTPTINMIVKRQLEIDNFIVRIYYTVIADLVAFKAESRDIDDQKEAEAIAEKCRGKEAVVIKYEQESKRENPPALYDLTNLQRDANRIFGYSAKQTLDTAQQLYEKKIITYPRTDSRYLTSDMETSARSTIENLIKGDILDKPTVDSYDFSLIKMSQVINNKKVTDHHALIPTASVTKSKIESLTVVERNILMLIIMRILISPYVVHIYKLTKVELMIEGEVFKVTGREIIQDGFKQMEKQLRNTIFKTSEKNQSQTANDNLPLPTMKKGDKFDVKDAVPKTKNTQPPKPYTEDTLLSSMETAGKSITDVELKEAIKDNGLGTPATRAGIIENVIKAGYIERKQKQLIPTQVAYTFIQLVPDKLKNPEMTAEWEKQLEEINKGKVEAEKFVASITEYVKNLVESKKNEDSGELKQIFKSYAGSKGYKSLSGEPLGVCPRCKKNVVETKAAYSCESGREGCGFVVWKTIAGKTLTNAQVKKLLSKRKTDLIKGFKSKAGKEFDAHIILKEDNTTRFEFTQ